MTVSHTNICIPPLSLDRYMRHLLRGEYERAGDVPPSFDREDHVRMARRMRSACARPELYPDPRHFAYVLGVSTICEHVSGCYGEINAGSEIIYSSRGGPRMWGLRVYHGLAHWTLRTWYSNEYEESDAWLLTAEMACCSDHLRVSGPAAVIDENHFVPGWLVELMYPLALAA